MSRVAVVIVAFAVALLTAPLPADAQQARTVRVGWLAPVLVPSDFEPFRQALREFGYIEGDNFVIEQRYLPEGGADYAALAADLVRLKVDVIVATGNAAARAALKASTTIPIVFFTGNPLTSGLVPSLSHPGGNLTGFASLAADLNPKRVELLREVAPGMVRLAFLMDVSGATTPSLQAANWQSAEAAVRKLGLQLLPALDVRAEEDFERAFALAVKQRAGGVLVQSSVLFNARRQRIVTLAAKSRLPAIYYQQEFVEDGGLMSYGPSNRDVYRRAAAYVDKILKGARPGDLPVEQVADFRLVINLKTARALGLTIPQSVLLRADELIQ